MLGLTMNKPRWFASSKEAEGDIQELFVELWKKLLAREKNEANLRNLWKKISLKTNLVANAGISGAPYHYGLVKDFGGSIPLFFPLLFWPVQPVLTGSSSYGSANPRRIPPSPSRSPCPGVPFVSVTLGSPGRGRWVAEARVSLHACEPE